MITPQTIFKYLIFVVFLYLFTLILSPFLISIVFAAFFTIAFYPLFKTFHRKLKWNKSLSAFLVILITIIFILAPILIFVGLVGKEAFDFMQTFDKNTALQFLDKYSDFQVFGYEFDLESLKGQVKSLLQNTANTIYVIATDVGSAIANFAFLFFVFIFLYFYFLRDGKILIEKIKQLLPFDKKQNSTLLKEFKSIAKAVFVANVSVAILSGIIAFIGFKIFGLHGALIWALLAAILSLIPTIGTFIVYFIAGVIIAFLSGWQFAVGLLIYFLILDFGIKENYIKSKLLDDKFPIHPILVFFALIGGVHMFGSMGIIYGPIIVVIFITIFEFVINTKKR